MSDVKPAKGWPERKVLEGQYCRLEPLSVDHTAGLFAATAGDGEDERYAYLFESPFADEAALAAWVAKAAALEDPLHFAVIDKASGKAAGRQALMRITPEHGVIEIGSILWGRGIARTRLATEALFLFARYAFDALGYRRFEWKCNDLNEPSKHAAKRFGFRFEGVFRQHMIVKGKNRDTAWFAMLDGDWTELKAEYERWLASENFGPDGKQKADLRSILASA